MKSPELDPLPDDLAELFGAERARPPASAAQGARILARLDASLAAGGGGGGPTQSGGGSSPPAGPAPTNGGATAASLAHPLWMSLATFLLGAFVGAGLHASVSTPVAASAAAPRVILVEVPGRPSKSEVSATPAPEPAPAASALAAPVATPTVTSSARRNDDADAGASGRDTDLAAERAGLEIARTALGRGQSGQALQALECQAAEFPRGRLGEEREALWIQALIASGKLEDARARAARFKKSFPRSMALGAIEAALGTIP